VPPHPKRKLSKGRRDRRRANDALQPVHLVKCKQCGSMRLPHHACPDCGTYNGQTVLDVEERSRRPASRPAVRSVAHLPQQGGEQTHDL